MTEAEDMLETVLAEIASELHCPPDNEAILQAISDLKALPANSPEAARAFFEDYARRDGYDIRRKRVDGGGDYIAATTEAAWLFFRQGIRSVTTHKSPTSPARRRYATEEEEMTALGSPPRKLLGWGDCKCTLTQYCDGRCNPLYADEPDTAQQTKPVAWAVFAPNGNIRLWSTDCEAVRKFAAEKAMPLTELYAHPRSA